MLVAPSAQSSGGTALCGMCFPGRLRLLFGSRASRPMRLRSADGGSISCCLQSAYVELLGSECKQNAPSRYLLSS